MRLTLKSRILALMLAIGLVRVALAAFEDMPMSPRATAMGGAALSSDGDSTSLFLNPAAMAGARCGDGYFMYDQLYSGLSGVSAISQGLITAASPTPWGVVGAGVGTLNASGLENEREIGLSYARKVGPFGLGVTGKELYQGYEVGGDPLAASDPVFANGTSRSAFAVDAGAIYDDGRPLKLGLAVRNINQPNVGLASVDSVARQFQASAAYVWPRSAVRATADFLYTAQPSGAFQERILPSMGLEKAFSRGRAAFRLGVSTLGLSAGMGLRMGALGLDYAVVIARTMLSGNFGTQMLGLSYRFGRGSSDSYAEQKPSAPVLPPGSFGAPSIPLVPVSAIYEPL